MFCVDKAASCYSLGGKTLISFCLEEAGKSFWHCHYGSTKKQRGREGKWKVIRITMTGHFLSTKKNLLFSLLQNPIPEHKIPGEHKKFPK